MKVQETGGEEAAGKSISQREAANEEIGRPLPQGGCGSYDCQHDRIFHQRDRTCQETDGANGHPLRLVQDHEAFQILVRPVACEEAHVSRHLSWHSTGREEYFINLFTPPNGNHTVTHNAVIKGLSRRSTKSLQIPYKI